MKKRVISRFLVVALLGIAQTVYAQDFPYHLYAPRTMAELAELSSVAEETQTIGLTQIGISAKPFYSAVRLEYVGGPRDLTERKLGFYKIWASALNVQSANTKANVLDILQKEYLFKECDKEYWITVSTPAANDLPKNMKKGDRITLYLMLAGGMKFDKEAWNGMYLANSFRNYE
ncbi:MAG TPA: hypothetical protein PKD24_15690 [Pyrinomonadaceae bacterium]|nr:hypothetical protein [Pyrinomonadaceae bacterium]HMP66258.1 hypothetical protein [Pyrinomonadaceae bacterium]